MSEAALDETDPVSARLYRLAAVRTAMAASGIEAMCVSLGADLPWLTGYTAMPLERPTVLVLPLDETPTLVVPALEAPRVVAEERLFALRPWRDGEDPIAIVAELIGARRRLAISDAAWAGLLIDLGAVLDGVEWHRASLVTGPIRAVKDRAEIAALAAASAAADRVAAALLAGEVRLVGRSEAEVSRELGQRLLAEGHAKVNFAIVGSGPNAASPHHEAGDRRIEAGEAVVCDFGGTFRLGDEPGYCSDITRTFVTGPASSEFLELYDVLERAQALAVAAVAVGKPCEEIDRVARSAIAAAGFGEAFIHRTGHGIGLEEHEAPYIAAGNKTLVRAGHAFSVEPGIYLAGRTGARIEDIVVVTDDGPIALNTVSHSLHVVG